MDCAEQFVQSQRNAPLRVNRGNGPPRSATALPISSRGCTHTSRKRFQPNCHRGEHLRTLGRSDPGSDNSPMGTWKIDAKRKPGVLCMVLEGNFTTDEMTAFVA